MSVKMSVVKRNGSREPLDIEKIHKVVFWATDGLTGVSASEVEIKSQIQFYDGIKTTDIHETLIKAAADLISEESPNYQFVAGRLVNYQVRKQVYGSYDPLPIAEIIARNIESGFYDSKLLGLYTADEWKAIDDFIDHDRDMSLAYCAMEQMRGKYLVQNRFTGELLETPQILYALVAATLFANYPTATRLRWVRDYYDAISSHEISLPTPVMAGVRTNIRQASSCTLIETADSLKSITATSGAIVEYVSNRAGIGIGAGSIRALGSPIRNGDATHTGVTSFFKLFQASVNSCNQGGVRKGSATLHYPIWHLEIEDMLVLKNNKGTEENRVRQMDYSVQINKLFYERLIGGGYVTLFSPHDVPEMYEAFFADQELFRAMYESAEKNPNLRKKTIKALDLFTSLANERRDTGRIYIMNVDNCNTHSAFIEKVAPVRMSNLCLTGDTMVTIMRQDGEVADVRLGLIGEEMRAGPVKVWSRNIKTGKLEFQSIMAFAMTSPAAKVLKIRDKESGRSITCTPDHQIYTTNRGYVRAADLRSDDMLFLTGNNGKFSLLEEGPWVEIEEVDGFHAVYDITVENNENFFANDILVHNCQEITLPTVPMATIESTRVTIPLAELPIFMAAANNEGKQVQIICMKYIDGDEKQFVEVEVSEDKSLIALCTLSAINWGVVKSPDDFQRICRLAVRGLDALLDYQNYPVEAARRHTELYRPLGIGIINFAYFLAKNGARYSDDSGLSLVDEYAEAWSYYLIRASVDLAKEFGPCRGWKNTKYGQGIVPLDTRKAKIDELVPHVERLDWEGLRNDLREFGIRNSTLMALMPAETSAQVANATNGIEPPRDLVSVKQSKHGVLKQVVPEIRRLKRKYDLLWDQKSPEGYLKLCGVLQKYIDQAISVNTSYNPKFYENGTVPMSELLRHILMHYSMGGKTLYYNNSLDNAGEVNVDQLVADGDISIQTADEEACESCTI